MTWAWPDEGEVTRVSTSRDVVKESLVTEGVSRPFNSTNRTHEMNNYIYNEMTSEPVVFLL